MARRFKAVLFDVGGPIDTEIEHERLFDLHIREALADEGVVVTDGQFDRANTQAVATFAPNAYSAIVWELAGHDAEVAVRALARVAGRSQERWEARGGVELRPGIDRVINRMSASGMRLGLAANQPARVIAELDRHGVGRFFSHREVTGHHGYRKPDVRLFLRALEDLGVEAEECVMVGDRIDNDIAPGKWLGMTAVCFRTGRHIEQQPRSWEEAPDAEVWNADELLDALVRLIEGA